MSEKGKGTGIEARIAALKAQAEVAEKERVKLEAMAQEARKDAETIIPKIQAEAAAIDGEIQKLQQRKSALLDQLRLLGLKVKAKGGVVGKREGGLADKMKELMSGVGVGGQITNSNIQEHLGSASGYVGIIIHAQIEAGNLKRTAPGTFEVTGIPM